MHKAKGIIFVVIGTVLILSALSLYLFNQREDTEAGRESEILLNQLQSMLPDSPDTPSETSEKLSGEQPELPDIPEPTQPDSLTSETEQEAQETSPAVPEITINGYDFIGIISLPALELDLPVMSEWDYTRLKLAPCRQFGSPETDDLVIAAHNYKNHFGKLGKLTESDSVIFTDMNGNKNYYTVKKTETVNQTDVEAVQNSGYALALYTCTMSGNTRITVFCDRTEQ